MSENLLDEFLALASKATTSTRQLKETDIFSKDNDQPKTSTSNLIHTGDTDSSDDEDNKYYEERNYNECGREIKHLLKSVETSEPEPDRTKSSEDTWKSKPKVQQLAVKSPPPAPKKLDVYTDPIFGLRIVNPLVSFTTLQEKMQGREAVNFLTIKKFVTGNIAEKNWVLAGVVVGKSPVRTSQKGSQFLIWTLSDLKADIKTVSVFLFGNSYKQLWKTPIGTVVGILNPNVMPKSSSIKDEATLSVDNPQKVLTLGQSRDLGKCKSTRKDGQPCTAIVNINNCEYCIYHIKQEYQKCSKRSELQANFAGRGLTALRNKVLGKNEVFYAGKSFTAIPAKRSKKLEERDGNLLQALSGRNPCGNGKLAKKRQPKGVKSAANMEVTHRQRLKDLTLLEKLGSVKTPFTALHSSETTLESSKKLVTDVLTKLRESKSDLSKAENKNPVATSGNETSENVSKTDKTNPVASGGNKTSENLSKTECMNIGSKTNGNLSQVDRKIVETGSKVVPSGSSGGTKVTLTKSQDSRLDTLLAMDFPLLSGGEKEVIDLDSKVTTKQVDRAKLNALKYIQRNGPLKKADPNAVKKPENKKRALEAIENQEQPSKKTKVENGFLSDRFKKIMEATSKHTDLLDVKDNEEQEKYFHKLELKEQMEEKMIHTYKVPCKAVRCLQCKYTNFSASQFCKDNKHPLKVFDAVKRFFKCGDCGNRTQALEVVPTVACTNCGSGKWERTGMMKEKTVGVGVPLSIRGGEQKFTNSVVTDANLDLLVPDA